MHLLITKLIATQKNQSLILECGPSFFGTKNIVAKINKLIEQTQTEYNLALQVLIYTRAELAHSSFMSDNEHDDARKVTALYQRLNQNSLPFNLALNGSPLRFLCRDLDKKELCFLEKLQESGVRNKVRNSVTITDNALLKTIKDKFSELEVVASCISTVFQPNLEDYMKHYGPFETDESLLLNYHSLLYSRYDKVVPLSQLTSSGFLSDLFDLNRALISDNTIVFLNHFCGQHDLGKCAKHYNGNEFNWGADPSITMPIIPDKYLVKKEELPDDELHRVCAESFDSFKLINRPRDLRQLIQMGIHQFKIPARLTSAEERAQSQGEFAMLCRIFAETDCGSLQPNPIPVYARTTWPGIGFNDATQKKLPDIQINIPLTAARAIFHTPGTIYI